VRSDGAHTEKVAANQNSSSDGGSYAAEVAACTVGGVGGEPGMDAHTTEAAADPASDTDGDVRGCDCPAGPDDSDAAVSDYSYTTINNFLIVGSVSEILMSHSSGTAASSNLAHDMAANGSVMATAVDSDAVADGVVDRCDSDITTGGTVVKAVSSDSKAVSVGVSDVTWSEAACRCGSAAAPGPGRADSEEISCLENGQEPRNAYYRRCIRGGCYFPDSPSRAILPASGPSRQSFNHELVCSPQRYEAGELGELVHRTCSSLASRENLFIVPALYQTLL
jgi:hypothetical protein